MPDHFIAFWNLENLFAPEGHPGRPAWLEARVGRDLRGWTEALFTRKLGQLARIVAAMNRGAGPDILGVSEVENRFVLDRLAETLNVALPGRSYAVVHAEAEHDTRGIDTAFLYDGARFTVDPAAIFSHFVLRRTGTRDILQATFRTVPGGNELVLLCNHWPSRSGGTPRSSAGFRATAGETLAYWHERIREVKGDDTAIMAFGDFNDEPWDDSVRFNALAGRERGDVERARSAQFYNLAWRCLAAETEDHRGDLRQIDGTLYFQNDGNVFDMILASRPVLDARGPFLLREETAAIVLVPEMVSHRAGEGPIRFGLPDGDAAKNVNPDGFSDHFPVAVVVEER